MSSSYKVPDFETLPHFDLDHFEYVLTPTKHIGGNKFIVRGAPIDPSVPTAFTNLVNAGEFGLVNKYNQEMRIGGNYICTFKILPKIEGRRTQWVAADVVFDVKDFAVKNITERALDAWRFKFLSKEMKQLYAAYGEHALMVLSHNPSLVQESLKLTYHKMLRLNHEWENIRAFWHEMRVLLRFNIDVRNTHLIIDSYRGDSAAMNRHPFRVIQRIRLERSVQKNYFRAMGVIEAAHDLLEPNMRDYLDAVGEREGSTALDIEDAMLDASESLDTPFSKVEMTMHDMILNNRADYRVLGENCSVTMGKSLRNDRSVGDVLAHRIKRHPNAPDYKDYEGEMKDDGTLIVHNQDQKTSIYQSLQNKTSIITGGPGTGKTTTAKTLIRELRVLNPTGRIILAAPTGKAARRMSDVTHLPCVTMHRMLGIVPGSSSILAGFGDDDTLIIDEMSMVDLKLFASVVKGTGDRGRVILLGDADQLASVDSGDVFNDMILCRRIPVARLDEVQRQAKESNIVMGAYDVLDGKVPEFAKDLHFVSSKTPDDIKASVIDLVSNVIPNQYGIGLENIQVLGAMRSHEAGINELNKILKPIFNPDAVSGKGIFRQLGSVYYHVGDRVMYLRNRYDRDVQNGEIGTVMGFSQANQEMTLNIDGREVKVPYENYQDITHAWASTVHKSQGSEYDAVIFVMPEKHARMLTRSLIFTALTRGKKHVFVVSDEGTLINVISRKQAPKRRTHLSFIVSEALNESSESPLFRQMIKRVSAAKPRRKRQIRAEDVEVPF